MRSLRFCSLAIVATVSLAGSSGCVGDDTGSPCQFSWYENQCNDFPQCAPLQDTSGAVTINNRSCPSDCLQLQSMECENLVCAATQITEGSTEEQNYHMNGQCESPSVSTTCPSAPLSCMGYCTKECLSDASCPKGYSCSHMAPFGGNLRCDPPEQWGDNCTDSCTKAGQGACPSTSSQSWDRSICNDPANSSCCACICRTYCPLAQKRFCRKKGWDQNMFPNAKVDPSIQGRCEQK
jgi:hypothetical protein